MASILSIVSYYSTRWFGARKRFAAIHRANVWGDDESASGKGSRRDSEAVHESLKALNFAIERYSIQSIADIPCGDVNWIGIFLEQNPTIIYHGYDIVKKLVLNNTKKFPNLPFSNLDIINEVPQKADIIFCKDLVNHLTTYEIKKSIRNIIRSGSKYLLITNNFGAQILELPQFKMATSRAVDLTIQPFNLPQPEWRTDYFALWNLDSLRQFAD